MRGKHSTLDSLRKKLPTLANMRQNLPTLILRITTVLSAVAGVLICVFVLPQFGTAIAKNFPEYAFWQYPILVGTYTAAACFFFALFQFWILLRGIDEDSKLSAKRLRSIRFCAIAYSALYYFFAMPVIFLFAEAEDAPGIILFAFFLGLFPICIAAVAWILERISSNKPKERLR